MSPRLLALPLLLIAGWANAQTPNCAGVPKALPMSPDVLPPVSSEFASPYSDLGAPSGVLSRAYDQTLLADQVILRLKIETCRSVASVASRCLSPSWPSPWLPWVSWAWWVCRCAPWPIPRPPYAAPRPCA